MLVSRLALARLSNLSYPMVATGAFDMINAITRVPQPINEPVSSYAPGTPERATLKEALKRMASERVEIPMVIGGQPTRSGKTGEVRMPHKRAHVLGTFQEADASHVD